MTDLESICKDDQKCEPFRDIPMEDPDVFIPYSTQDQRPGQFEWKKLEDWQRPQSSDGARLAAALCYEQARFLHEVIKEKDKEILILRKELLKVNEMNYKLTRDLDRLRVTMKRQKKN